MSSLYEDLVQGLTEAIEIKDGKRQGRITEIEIPELIRYSGKEVRRIRNDANLSQTMLAKFMGVSKKTVEAWEHGTNSPTGPACRLLSIIDERKSIL